MDVEALYTNIDHQQGLAALRHFLRGRPEYEMPPTDFLLALTEWTLTNNIFVFQDKIFKQTKGCAMGACYSPSYAGLYLGKWEEDFIFNQESHLFYKYIIWWGRYIDDICLFWSGSETELKEFHGYLNSINSNIKLSLEYSKKCINFLDLTISKDNQGILHTSVYRKPTDRNTILHAKSFHPNWLIENIPYGQFQRVKRICDQEHIFESKSLEMMSRFKERGYRSSILKKAYTRAQQVDRSVLLQRNTWKQTKQRPVFVTTYSTEAEQIR